MPNRLANETSPYLLQHANNPVDWYPWGEEALERSRSLNKPILLSIGYSACHWCHVMEHESFENPRIAEIMNEHFVSIKVDREERPDLDSIYMEAVQAMTGRGGWPMTVFLTPDLRPFYGGTYFPPQDRFGMPGFARVLLSVAKTYQESSAEVAESAEAITQHIQHERNTALEGEVNEENLARAFDGIAARIDMAEGGFGGAPKFPPSVSLEFLLRMHLRGDGAAPLSMVETTLTKMAYGGIYDQLGGGFHRYSVDDRWLVPHFEKMLYDSALLSLVYLHGWQATGNGLYQRIARETLDYVLREMTSPEGGFYSSQDADSEGHEGLFYTWTADEIRSIVPDSSAFERYYGVTEEGNFEGRNILNVPVDPDTVAADLGLESSELESQLQDAKKRLLTVRGERVSPGRDDKVLSGWNGLMLRAFAEAAAGLDDSVYLGAARRNADFLLTRMRRGHRMLRTYKDGGAKLNGYLEDQAYVASGMLALFEADFDPRWLSAACELADEAIEYYWSEDDATLYETSSDHERLLVRPRSFADNATPAAAGVMTDVLLRLSRLTGRRQYEEISLRVLATSQTAFIRYPSGFASYLCAQDFLLGNPVEIAIAGSLEDARTWGLVRAVREGYRPHQVVAAGEPGAEFGPASPLMTDRELVREQPAAYVCRGFTCSLPVTTVDELKPALGEGPAAT